MLVRTQLMLEETQKQELQEIAAFYNFSMSEKAREIFYKSILSEKKKIKKIAKKQTSGIEFLDYLVKNAVQGPGDSEYDKYAYDF